jgi:hypothetical protein
VVPRRETPTGWPVTEGDIQLTPHLAEEKNIVVALLNQMS